jgi:hypothetical protein
MARDQFVDILLEVPAYELADLQDPSQELYEVMRVAAQKKCAEIGARIDAGLGPVEVLVQHAQHPLLGDYALVASRWAVVAS